MFLPELVNLFRESNGGRLGGNSCIPDRHEYFLQDAKHSVGMQEACISAQHTVHG